MADQKISTLPAAANADLTDSYETVHGGVSNKVTLQQLADRLGLGSGLISFNNADGSAVFAGGLVTIAAGGTLASVGWSITPNGASVLSTIAGTDCTLSGVAGSSIGTWYIQPDGSAAFANGTVTINVNGAMFNAANSFWQINPDGSSFFANGATTFGNNGTASFAGGQLTIGDDGTIIGPGSGSVWQINPDGSAVFGNGGVTISVASEIGCNSLSVSAGAALIDTNGNVTAGHLDCDDIQCVTLEVSGGASINAAGDTQIHSLAIAGGQALTGLLTATAALDFPNTLAQTSSDLTITVSGAALGDTVSIGVPNGSVLPNSSYSGWVSAANTVTIRFTNAGALPRDPASGTFRATVMKF